MFKLAYCCQATTIANFDKIKYLQ